MLRSFSWPLAVVSRAGIAGCMDRRGAMVERDRIFVADERLGSV